MIHLAPNATIDLAGRKIGPGHPAFIVAEVAQAHDGSLGAAHALIDVAADCGVDAVKFQTHIASAESTIDEVFRVKFSRQDDTRYAYWQRMEFTPGQWQGLAQHAREAGLIFMSSPFSLEALELLESLQVPAWKVASGELEHHDLLNAMADTGKPVLVSSGMSSYADVEATIGHLRHRRPGLEIGLFQCTTRYPTPAKEVGLNVISELRTRFAIPVGLSDHSGDVLPSIAAMCLGADMIEVHLALHPKQFGPDTIASLLPAQLTELCRARDMVHQMLTHPVDKDAIAANMEPTKALFSRSLALRQNQPRGTVLTREMLTLKKPGGGLPETAMSTWIGKALANDVPANRLLRTTDFDN
jgi:N,N'-diacetyllegionaminate synthase